jgi:hypothetical protein
MDEQYRLDAYLCKFYTKMILAFRHVRGFYKAMEEMKYQIWVQEKKQMAAIKMKNKSLARLRRKGKDIKTRNKQLIKL